MEKINYSPVLLNNIDIQKPLTTDYNLFRRIIDRIMDFFCSSNVYEIKSMVFALCSKETSDKKKFELFARLFKLADQDGKALFSGAIDETRRLHILKLADVEFQLSMGGKTSAEYLADLFFDSPTQQEIAMVSDILDAHDSDAYKNRAALIGSLKLQAQTPNHLGNLIDISYDGDLSGKLNIHHCTEISLKGAEFLGNISKMESELRERIALEMKECSKIASAIRNHHNNSYIKSVTAFLNDLKAPFPVRGDKDHDIFSVTRRDINRSAYSINGQTLERRGTCDPAKEAQALTSFCTMLGNIGCSLEQRNVILSTCNQNATLSINHSLDNPIMPAGEKTINQFNIRKGDGEDIVVENYTIATSYDNAAENGNIIDMLETESICHSWLIHKVIFTISPDGDIKVTECYMRTLMAPLESEPALSNPQLDDNVIHP